MRPATGERAGVIALVDLGATPPALRPAGPELCRPPAPGEPFRWLDVDLSHPGGAEAVSEAFGIHPLALEDVREQGQRQKLERYRNHLFISVREPRGDPHEPHPEELFLAAGPGWAVTFHAGREDWVREVAARVATRADLDQNGGMAVAAALLDQVVDGLEGLLDHLEEEVAAQEEAALESRRGDPVPSLRRASVIRYRVSRVRREAGQLRELVGALVRVELGNREHTDELDLELRDVADHVQRALDDLGVLHDRMTALAETRLALVAYRQNEITKRLSAWGAILLVPTVVTGWFGMNFRHLPALASPAGPILTFAGILGACLILVAVFRRSGWL